MPRDVARCERPPSPPGHRGDCLGAAGLSPLGRLPSPDRATRFAPTRWGTVVGVSAGLGGAGGAPYPAASPGRNRFLYPRRGPCPRGPSPDRRWNIRRGARDRNCRAAGVEWWAGGQRALERRAARGLAPWRQAQPPAPCPRRARPHAWPNGAGAQPPLAGGPRRMPRCRRGPRSRPGVAEGR